MERVLAVQNETKSTATRVTKEGKSITYCMHVLQQPARARACGAGAKSSADRRPVDPPPIVELRIFDGEGQSKDNDITFTLNANYFLFATLEQARPIAQARGLASESRLTVLTGTPVAGMVYLDRPAPAGYFIFPDLSVRHEGKYRLSFSLYEELKETKDEDKSEEGAAKAPGSSEAHVTHRLEVKSEPFTVYSAKKFPGLSESTNLSRTVAEQGCRVRIRRDVRMRRRDGKPGGKDWDDYEEDTAHERAKHSATPDGYGYPQMPTPYGSMDAIARPRSASNASHHSLAASLSRRPSLQEMSQAFHHQQACASSQHSQHSQQSLPPHTPQHGYPQQSPYGPSPTQQYQPPAYQQSTMHPPAPQYTPQAYQQPMPAPASQSYYGYAPAPAPTPAPAAQQQYTPAQTQYEQPPPPPPPQQQRLSVDYTQPMQPDYRRASQHMQPQQSSYLPQQSQPTYQSQQQQQSYQPQQPQQTSYQNQPTHSAPFGSISDYGRHMSTSSQPPRAPTPAAHGQMTNTNILPPLNTTLNISNSKLDPSSPASALPQSSYYSSSTALTTPIESSHASKRSYSNVFPTAHMSQPLRQGARPTTPYGSGVHHASISSANAVYTAADADEADEAEVDLSRLRMLYRRADGREIARPLPPSN